MSQTLFVVRRAQGATASFGGAMAANSHKWRFQYRLRTLALVVLIAASALALWKIDSTAFWLSLYGGVVANVLGVLLGIFVTYGLGIPRDGSLPWDPDETPWEQDDDPGRPTDAAASSQPVGAPSIDSATDRLVTVATFVEPSLAHVAKARLASHGIRAALDGEHHITMDWLISGAVGGVKLLVHQRDRESAVRSLNQAATEIDVTAIDDDPPRAAAPATCPACGSEHFYQQRLNRKLIYMSILLLDIPLPFLSRKMVCERCNHQWKPTRESRP